ncbi:hypothetical protein ColLi_08885 [Colletotrichum liriopes]|uniref:Uncharacterized protein n=1 Tax=Colletotrichum liriopes TaxID=708192 RepID=A0AA37GS93_9PEZI|nr:hypothetical protein ColLi_08885 [Colletotrichum liriopes]
MKAIATQRLNTVFFETVITRATGVIPISKNLATETTDRRLESTLTPCPVGKDSLPAHTRSLTRPTLIKGIGIRINTPGDQAAKLSHTIVAISPSLLLETRTYSRSNRSAPIPKLSNILHMRHLYRPVRTTWNMEIHLHRAQCPGTAIRLDRMAI